MLWVTPEHGWRRRAQDNALRRDLSESGLHVVDSLKLPPLSCDDALRFDANLFDRDVHLMRSPARHTRRQDNPVRIEHQVVGYYVVGGGSCRSRNEPRSGTGVSPRMCPWQSRVALYADLQLTLPVAVGTQLWCLQSIDHLHPHPRNSRASRQAVQSQAIGLGWRELSRTSCTTVAILDAPLHLVLLL